MSLLGMPWVVLNLGCEMVYILEQRLKSQGIAPDKSYKVLLDICKTMFDRSFLNEKLFVPQDMYSLHSTRKIFDRLAHSSIMRLSESSMDKLFDLMVMGAKYQLMCGTRLDDMVQVLLRHLGTVQAILMSATAECSPPGNIDPDVINSISQAEDATVKFYGTLGVGELALLRQTLARFFQDKRVKVSLFLAEGIQQPQSGKLVAPSCISNQVGLVRTFDDTGKLEREERLQVASQKADVKEFFCHPVTLGDNLYRKDRIKAVPPSRSADTQAAKSCHTLQQEQPAQAPRYAEDQGSKAAKQELDLLAALVQVSKTSADNFKLNLFEDETTDDEAVALQQSAEGVNSKKQQMLMQFGADGKNEGYIKSVGNVLDELGLEDEQHGSKTTGEDLLDLMDSVA